MRFASATPPIESFGIKAWNMMGAQVNWSALPIVAELLGVTDIEQLVDDVLCIDEHMTRQARNGRS